MPSLQELEPNRTCATLDTLGTGRVQQPQREAEQPRTCGWRLKEGTGPNSRSPAGSRRRVMPTMLQTLDADDAGPAQAAVATPVQPSRRKLSACPWCETSSREEGGEKECQSKPV